MLHRLAIKGVTRALTSARSACAPGCAYLAGECTKSPQPHLRSGFLQSTRGAAAVPIPRLFQLGWAMLLHFPPYAVAGKAVTSDYRRYQRVRTQRLDHAQGHQSFASRLVQQGVATQHPASVRCWSARPVVKWSVIAVVLNVRHILDYLSQHWKHPASQNYRTGSGPKACIIRPMCTPLPTTAQQQGGDVYMVHLPGDQSSVKLSICRHNHSSSPLLRKAHTWHW